MVQVFSGLRLEQMGRGLTTGGFDLPGDIREADSGELGAGKETGHLVNQDGFRESEHWAVTSLLPDLPPHWAIFSHCPLSLPSAHSLTAVTLSQDAKEHREPVLMARIPVEAQKSSTPSTLLWAQREPRLAEFKTRSRARSQGP